MAKVQGKKTAAGPKRTARKPVVRSKPSRTAKKAPKPAARKAKPVPKPKAKPALKVVPSKKPVPPPPPKAAPKHAPKPVPVPAAARPAAPEKKPRARRPRTRVHSDGAPVANWLVAGEKPRSSSFIPAPPRAEAPSLVAAPPASSDRLIRSDELTEFVVRTVPVRIDIESIAGRIYLSINPEEVTLHLGEGVEWDFRYLGGADVVIDDLIIEFEKPAPFPQTIFRSRRPGTNRPHRQLSGPAQPAAVGKRVRYVVRAFNGFKTEMAVARPSVSIA